MSESLSEKKDELEQAENRLRLWREAEDAIGRSGQSYTIEDGITRRTLTHANLAEVKKTVAFYKAEVERIKRSIRRNTSQNIIMFGRGL